mmetsp:Transcript_45184/g.115611  ORF Transcript_45184/g.115611 Transcript_45184/m.115611 type:complete len:244 (-) Transcript_45184:34-765(-)
MVNGMLYAYSVTPSGSTRAMISLLRESTCPCIDLRASASSFSRAATAAASSLSTFALAAANLLSMSAWHSALTACSWAWDSARAERRISSASALRAARLALLSFTSPTMPRSSASRLSSRSPTGVNQVLSRNTISSRNSVAMTGRVRLKSNSLPASACAGIAMITLATAARVAGFTALMAASTNAGLSCCCARTATTRAAGRAARTVTRAAGLMAMAERATVMEAIVVEKRGREGIRRREQTE